MKQGIKARALLTGSMAIFGTLGLFTRHISVNSGELALYRAVLALGPVALYLLLSHKRLDIGLLKKEAPLLLLSGAAMGVNWILLFQAYRFTTLSAATLSYYFAPVLVTIFCPLLFKERLTARQILCFVMSTVGLVLIIGVDNLTRGGSDLKGILFGLGAAVFYASVVLLNKYIKKTEGIQRTLVQFLAAIVVLAPYVALSGGFSLGGLNSTGWLCLLAVGLIHTGVTYCMYFSALRDVPGQEAAILSYIDPVVAVLISVLVLGEPMSPAQALGGALIIGFTLINELPQRKRQ